VNLIARLADARRATRARRLLTATPCPTFPISREVVERQLSGEPGRHRTGRAPLAARTLRLRLWREDLRRQVRGAGVAQRADEQRAAQWLRETTELRAQHEVTVLTGYFLDGGASA
jgi:hypothetical protein